MTQMFELVAERLKKDQIVANQEESRDSLCLLLARLRIFRPVHFDRLMSKWARSIVASSDYSATTLILALVNFGCLPISAIVQDLQELETDDSSGHFRHSRRNVAWLLCDSVLSASLSTEPAQYRFRTLWAQYLAHNPVDALSILPVIKSECTKVQLDFNLKRTNWMPPLLSGIALRDSYRSADYGPEVRGLLEEGLGVLFEGDTIGASEGVEIQQVIDVCDDFSLPFCQLQLRITSTHPGSIHQDSRSSIVKALFSLATRDPAVADQEAASGAWVPLAAAAGVEIACPLREKAEQAFFGVDVPLWSGRVGASPLAGSHPEASILRAARHLDVVSKMAYTIPETGAPGICSQLNEKLAAVWRALNVNNVPTAATPASGSQMNGPPTSTAMSTDPPVILDYLPLLLRFVCLHREALASKAISPLLAKQPSQEQVKLLVLLVSIALHSTISEQQHLAAQVLDVVATLVDGITEEARAACARCLKDKMRDCRVNYLFGTMNTLVGPEDGGSALQLVKEGKGVVGDWKVKQWELLEGGADTSLNLGLFQCREGSLKGGLL
jgi:mediator of RNA polymerase II transcription subunit 12